MEEEEFNANLGISRRTLIKRSAVVGGTLVWATPVVQSLSAPAFAYGSPACIVTTRHTNRRRTICRTVVFESTAACCECINDDIGCESDPCRDRKVISDETTQGPCPS